MPKKPLRKPPPVSEVPLLDEELKGPALREDALEYFKGIASVLGEGDLESKEDLHILVDNVFDEMTGHEYRLAVNKRFSVVLERLILLASPLQVRRFVTHLEKKCAALAADRNASHVLQALIFRLPALLNQGETVDMSEEDPSHPCPEALTVLVRMFLDELLTHWVALMRDPFGSFVLRDVVAFLSQTPLTRSHTPSDPNAPAQQQFSGLLDDTILHKFRKVLPKAVRTILGLTNRAFASLEFHVHGSPALQAVVGGLAAPVGGTAKTTRRRQKLLKKLMVHLLKWEQGPQDLASVKYVHDLMKHPHASHLMETVVDVMRADSLQLFVRHSLLGQLKDLALHRSANFVVQHAIASPRLTVELLSTILDELAPCLVQLVQEQKTGVIWKLAEACGRLAVRRREMITLCARAWGVDDVKENANMVHHMLCASNTGPMSGNGSRIVQTLLTYPSVCCKWVMKSLLALSAEDTVRLAQDAAGSRVLDAFLAAEFGSRTKTQFITKLNGHFCELAALPFGSFSVESCFRESPTSVKRHIASELCNGENKLLSVRYGRVILSKLQVDLFKRNPQQWAQHQSSKSKTEKLFADIVTEPEPATKTSTKKKRKRSREDEGEKKEKKKKKKRKGADKAE